MLVAGDAVLTTNFNVPWSLLRNKPDISAPLYLTTWDWAIAKDSIAALAKLPAASVGLRTWDSPGGHYHSTAADSFRRPFGSCRQERGRGCVVRAVGVYNPALGHCFLTFH